MTGGWITPVAWREHGEVLPLKTGVLVLFDRRDGAEPAEVRTRFEQAQTASGREILVLRG